jgi:PIN domain nuclease of toxin-antitoxin system
VTTAFITDTHPFLWFLGGSARLGPGAAGVFQDPRSRIVLPAIVLAEACWIIEHRRLGLSINQVLTALDADPRIVVFPLDRAVIERSNQITSINEMHDRQIVATALVLAERGEQVVLVTRDQNITESGLVPVVW